MKSRSSDCLSAVVAAGGGGGGEWVAERERQRREQLVVSEGKRRQVCVDQVGSRENEGAETASADQQQCGDKRCARTWMRRAATGVSACGAAICCTARRWAAAAAGCAALLLTLYVRLRTDAPGARPLWVSESGAELLPVAAFCSKARPQRPLAVGRQAQATLRYTCLVYGARWLRTGCRRG